jgi:hypothetical protein
LKSLSPSFFAVLSLALSGAQVAAAGEAPCRSTYDGVKDALKTVDVSSECENGTYECIEENALAIIGNHLGFSEEELSGVSYIASRLYAKDIAVSELGTTVSYHKQTSRDALAAAATGLKCAIEHDSLTTFTGAMVYACENFGKYRVRGSCYVLTKTSGVSFNF